MKNLVFTLVIAFGISSVTFANGIDLKKNEVVDCKVENNILKNQVELIENSVSVQIPRGIFEQIVYCAQVQMDVKETYTEIFGPDRANSIALGAFMGCMGYL